MHPPKRETFDVDALTNTDPKGIVRVVDQYRVEPWGLYMARPTPGRREFHYLQSWLLPTEGLRISIFHFNAGYERDLDFYLDIGEYTATDRRWESVDHYLDLMVRRGRDTELTDVDELLDACRAGLLSPDTAELAIHRAVRAVEGLAAHDHDPRRWLATKGMQLTWREVPEPARHD